MIIAVVLITAIATYSGYRQGYTHGYNEGEYGGRRCIPKNWWLP